MWTLAFVGVLSGTKASLGRVVSPCVPGVRRHARSAVFQFFLFGENDVDKGTNKVQMTTQAVIRTCSNSWGVRTCYAPGSGYKDDTLQENMTKIGADIDAAVVLVKTGGFHTLVIPIAGLGTGVANLRRGAPKTYAFLNEKLDAAKVALDHSRGKQLAKPPASQHSKAPVRQGSKEEMRRDEEEFLETFLKVPKPSSIEHDDGAGVFPAASASTR